MDDSKDENILIEPDERSEVKTGSRLKFGLGSLSKLSSGEKGSSYSIASQKNPKDKEKSSIITSVSAGSLTNVSAPSKRVEFFEAGDHQADETSASGRKSVRLIDERDGKSDPKRAMSTRSEGYARLLSTGFSVREEISDPVYPPTYERRGACWLCRHPVLKRNWKIYVSSIILTVVGLITAIVGVVLGVTNGFLSDIKSIILVVAGLLCLIPGAYHFIFMTLAAYDVRGFKFSRLPTIRHVT